MEKQVDSELIKSFVDNSKAIQQIEESISTAIANFQTDLEQKKKKEVDLKEALKTAMRDGEVKKFENDIISLTYIAPTQRKTIDTEKLKEEKPELWEEYSKVSEVSDSVRVKVK